MTVYFAKNNYLILFHFHFNSKKAGLYEVAFFGGSNLTTFIIQEDLT